MKCDLLNFRVVQNGYRQYFQHLIISIHFFHEVPALMQSFMLDKLQSRKKKFSIFLIERPHYTLKLSFLMDIFLIKMKIDSFL